MQIVVLLLLLAPGARAEEFYGRVVGVSDGDTITVLKGRASTRVRLAEIDAPESNQAFGQRAKQATSHLAFGKTVRVIARGQDRYGRMLGTVVLPDGTILNEQLVADGWAWQYIAYSKEERLGNLEATARRDKRGLWADPHPVPPWEFRARKHEPASIR